MGQENIGGGGELGLNSLLEQFFEQKYSGDQTRENAMSGTCDTCGGEDGCMQSFGGEMKERDHLEDLALDGRIILEDILQK